jgi:hypothetical protein
MNYLELTGNINKEQKYSGIDDYHECFDQHHFLNYNKPISYKYNTKGFRDKEWPTDTKNRIWCIGDSFTSGIGQPQHETWPALLEDTLGERCINVGEDGCSNDLITLRAKQIIHQHQPKLIVVMWSYFWRRYLQGENLHYDKNKRELPKHDMDNFIKNLTTVNGMFENIINLVVPDCFIESSIDKVHVSKEKKKKNINRLLSVSTATQLPDIIEVEQVDYARDGHHFDILTCQNLVKDVVSYINSKLSI